jgi:hypothetical protein
MQWRVSRGRHGAFGEWSSTIGLTVESLRLAAGMTLQKSLVHLAADQEDGGIIGCTPIGSALRDYVSNLAKLRALFKRTCDALNTW